MPDQPIPELSESEKQRVVRVFVSSTFRDMYDEREELTKYVFPELRKRCKERRVEFVDVDLRWGVTEEQAERGEALPICLAEIHKTRPYFIGILGDRYGWVPDKIEKKVTDEHAWLEKHTGKSITSLEIQYGILEDTEMKGLAFFYFRDPKTSEKIEADLSKKPDYKPDPKTSHDKLKALKESICKSGYPVRENYPDHKSLAKMVLDDLWAVIDKRFPEEEVPTALEYERMGHEQFAAARTKVYIGRDEYFTQLNDHVNSTNPPLVLTGESGAGKSALISKWVTEYKKAHSGEFMVLHFIGSTPESASYTKIIRRIMEEIKIREQERLGKKGIGEKEEGISLSSMGGDKDEIPSDPGKLVEVFPLWLARAAAMGKCTIILDGLNQLEDKDNAPDLGWLPEFFTENIRVITSTLKGRSLDALKKRNYQTITIQPFTSEERKKFIVEYLSRYSKKLSEPQTDHVASHKQTANPLYLRTLLEELRVFGIYEGLDNKIKDYLKAQTVDDLFEMILERLEADYGREHKGLVKDVMAMLWASRRGLSEKEILGLLNIPQAVWSPLHNALEESLVSRSGLLTFFHDYLRKAVEDRYLKHTESKHASHLRLADYFEKKEIDDRKADELPWQLCQAESWERLKDCITDMNMFLKLMIDTTQYELMGYWLAMGDRFDMVESYNTALSRWEQTRPSDDTVSFTLNRVAQFLVLNAKYEGAEPLYRRALDIREKVLGKEHPDTAESLNNLAELLHSKGDYVGAEPLNRRALAIFEKVLGKEHLETFITLNNLAELLSDKNDYDEAELIHRRALTIGEKILGSEHPDTAKNLYNIAGLLWRKGDYKSAELLHRKALTIREKVLGKEHPDTAASLNGLALVIYSKGDYEEAESLYRQALIIFEGMIGAEHPDTAQILNNLALLLYYKRDYVRAEPLHRRALAIREKILGSEHSDTALSLNNLALVLHSKRDYVGAELLHRRALAIREKALGKEHPDTAQSLSNLAELLRSKGDYEGAEPLCRRALEIYEKALGKDHPDTVLSRRNQRNWIFGKYFTIVIGYLFIALGVFLGVWMPWLWILGVPLILYGVIWCVIVCSKVKKQKINTIFNLAQLLRDKGDHKGSAPLYRQLIEIHEELLKKNVPILPHILDKFATGSNNLAFYTLVPERNWKEAGHYYKKAIELFNKVPNPVEAANSEMNLQTMYHLSGQQVDVERVKALTRILEEVKDKRAEKGHKILKDISDK